MLDGSPRARAHAAAVHVTAPEQNAWQRLLELWRRRLALTWRVRPIWRI